MSIKINDRDMSWRYRQSKDRVVIPEAVYTLIEEDTPVTDPPYLIFRSPNPFTLKTSNTIVNWDGTLEYSTDTVTWTIWDGTEISSGSVRNRHELYLRGTGNTKITGTSSAANKFVVTGTSISLLGNMENLLDYATVTGGGHPSMGTYCFSQMFNAAVSQNINDIVYIAPNLLSAVTLSNQCYTSMFTSCSNLTVVCNLPALTMTSRCYNNMFQGCTSLVLVPIDLLPSTTLSSYCYQSMFSGCTSLLNCPRLPATSLSGWCYQTMFSGCTSLEELPALPALAIGSASQCYNAMFMNCSNIKLSSTQDSTYVNEYRIPTAGTGTGSSSYVADMFINTGGTFSGTPTINTTYYTSNIVV